MRVGATVGVALVVAIAVGVVVGDALGDSDGEADGRACDTIVAIATGPRVGCATAVTTGKPPDGVAMGIAPFLLCNAERKAPIPSPATTTPTPSAIVGRTFAPGDPRRGGGAERRRRGGSDIEASFRAPTGRPPPVAGMSSVGMLRVAVPIDVSAVARTASAAFALATPLRVGDVLTAAVGEALGPRAPLDKKERVVRSTLAGLRDGSFVVEIDGKRYRDPDDIVVCSGTATLRFFRRALRAA